jgi:putative transposase
MKFKFMAAHRGEFDVISMCRALEVSTSGYYAWCKRPPGAREKANHDLVEHIRQVHQVSRQTYGSPRIHAELKAHGLVCSRNRIARLMRRYGIRARQPRRYRVTTDAHHAYPVAANLLNRQFTAEAPDQKWVTDITFIDTWEGWLYLAVVMDLYSRQIVGWSMADHLRTSLVEDALGMALARRCPAPGLLHHSDRGSQYASTDYQALLQAHGIQVSMSRTGDCYDNAAMESFFGTLKTESATDRYATRADARISLFEYIEVWYNRQRRHSTLGYLSPEEYERLHVVS